jgi:hypothetical protein
VVRDVTDTEQRAKHWSDEKVDVLATLVVFCSLVAAAVYFVATG